MSALQFKRGSRKRTTFNAASATDAKLTNITEVSRRFLY